MHINLCNFLSIVDLCLLVTFRLANDYNYIYIIICILHANLSNSEEYIANVHDQLSHPQ